MPHNYAHIYTKYSKNKEKEEIIMEIILYSQPTCPQCKMVHMLLDKNHINYTECQDLDQMKTIGINHTPALSVDGKILTGKEIFNYINDVKTFESQKESN